ncbi:MAG: TonB-dependent receptor, partial [Acidobacteria bacterium]|nr:TonB-dependent receptor [Acidobacteriota bacterium]
MHTKTLGALLGFMLLASSSWAQEQRGSIEGTVTDQSGAVLPGVTVEARSPSLVGVATSITDGTGSYRFPALPPGTYEVTASLSGFGPARIADVVITLGKTLRVDLTMKVAAQVEQVTVTGESPVIDIKSSASAASLRHEDFDLIPKGRDFTSIVRLAPGAKYEEKAGGISVDGASGAENKYILDGVDTTNLQVGTRAKPVLFDVVEEVQVKSSGYAAEYGGALGGVINVITRSGANALFGETGVYYTSDTLNGDPRPFLRLGLVDSTKSEYIPTSSGCDTTKANCFKKEGLRHVEPGFVVGGPVQRDRVWFFASYIPELQTTKRTVTFRSTGETGTFNEDYRAQNFTGKVNAQFSNALRGFFAANLRPDRSQGRLPDLDGTGNPAVKYSELGRRRPNASYSGNLDWVATNNLYFNIRGGFFAYDLRDVGIPSAVRHTFSESNQVPSSNGVLTAAEVATIPPELRFSRGYADLLTNSSYAKDNQNRLGAGFDGTYFANMAGRHVLKAGVQFIRLGNSVDQGEQGDLVTLGWGTFWTGLIGSNFGRDFAGTYGYYSYRQFKTTGDIHSNNIALFAQDSWEIKSRLTVNYGIRVEKEEVPSFNNTGIAINWGYGDKIAPRVGFAYDVTQDGRSKLYGSFGLFYDNMKLEMPRGSFGGEKWKEKYYTLDTPNWDRIGSGSYPGTFIEEVDWRATAIDLGLLDKNIKPMQSHEFTLGYDHQLGARSSMGVRYVRKQIDKVIEDTGYLGATGEEYFIGNPGFGIVNAPLTYDFTNPCPPPTCPALPRPQRDYDSVEFKYNRRLAERWSVDGSYTWSRLYGNYPGLANSNELRIAANAQLTGAGQDPRQPSGGRTSPNVTRLFDLPYQMFTEKGTPALGPLAVDRPHQIRLGATYIAPFNLSLGAFFYGASGTPITRQTNIVGSVPVFYKGYGSDGRTPFFNQTDLYLGYEVKLGPKQKVQFGA